VTIVDDAPGSPHVIPLAGPGGQPEIRLSPTALEFGSQAVGVTSVGQNITVTNNGTVTITALAFSVSGDFQQTNNCGTTLGGGGVCTITVTFTPATTGRISGAVAIASDAPGSPQVVALLGNGGS
jgi:hypothetical protein